MNLPDSGKPGVFVAENLEFSSGINKSKKQIRAEVTTDEYILVRNFAAKHNTTTQALLAKWIEPHISILRLIEES